MRTISILNFKGSTGKSSVAQNLEDALVTHKYAQIPAYPMPNPKI
jgi:cellulose biosynthesis protein BcsQ